MLEEVVLELVHDGEKLFLVLMVGLFGSLGAMKMLVRIMTSIASERTKREIAAYIAEGSISPEQGERLLKADSRGSGSC